MPLMFLLTCSNENDARVTLNFGDGTLPNASYDTYYNSVNQYVSAFDTYYDPGSNPVPLDVVTITVAVYNDTELLFQRDYPRLIKTAVLDFPAANGITVAVGAKNNLEKIVDFGKYGSFSINPGEEKTISILMESVLPPQNINGTLFASVGYFPLDWDPVYATDGYVIERSIVSDTGPFSVIGTSDTNSFADYSAQDETYYYWRIKAVFDFIGETDYSSVYQIFVYL